MFSTCSILKQHSKLLSRNNSSQDTNSHKVNKSPGEFLGQIKLYQVVRKEELEVRKGNCLWAKTYHYIWNKQLSGIIMKFKTWTTPRCISLNTGYTKCTNPQKRTGIENDVSTDLAEQHLENTSCTYMSCMIWKSIYLKGLCKDVKTGTL